MITVRKATLSNSEIVATYLLLAMEKIVYKFINETDPQKAQEFMLHLVKKENNQYSYQNCWVAEDDGEVVAAVNIYNGAQLIELRRPVLEYLASRFNNSFTPDDETQAGEYYIDFIGVNPNQQNKGTGTILLQFLIDEYVTRCKQTLGLLVDYENPNAKKLYTKLGFKSAGKKVLFGKNMEHMQRKN